MEWRSKRQPTPVFLPGESQGWLSLAGCHLWGHRVEHNWHDLAAAALSCSEMIEQLQFDKSRGQLSSTASCTISTSHDSRLWVGKLHYMSYYSAQIKGAFFFFLTVPHIMWNLSSPTRDRPHTLCALEVESLNHCTNREAKKGHVFF